MKITLNIPNKFIKSVMRRIIEGVQYDYYSAYNEEKFTHDKMNKDEKILFLNNIKDILPEIAKNAANDEMTPIFETVAELSKDIDQAKDKIRDKEEE